MCSRSVSFLLLLFVEGFMEADGLFALEGMHEPGSEQSLVEIREALEYYCLNFLQPWLQEYFYRKVGNLQLWTTTVRRDDFC